MTCLDYLFANVCLNDPLLCRPHSSLPGLLSGPGLQTTQGFLFITLCRLGEGFMRLPHSTTNDKLLPCLLLLLLLLLFSTTSVPLDSYTIGWGEEYPLDLHLISLQVRFYFCLVHFVTRSGVARHLILLKLLSQQSLVRFRTTPTQRRTLVLVLQLY